MTDPSVPQPPVEPTSPTDPAAPSATSVSSAEAPAVPGIGLSETNSVSGEAAGAPVETPASETATSEIATSEIAASEAAASVETQAESNEHQPASHDADGLLAYQNGDIVPGTVTAVRTDGFDLDLGDGRSAVAPANETTGPPVSVGDHVEGTVIRRQGTGRYVVSPKRAARTRAWARIVAAAETGEVQTGPVVETVKGGLIVDIGMRAFLPESLIDVRRTGKPADLVGQTVSVVVIEATKNADRPGERIVVSRKPIMEQERAKQRAQLITSLAAGDRRRGRVSALVPFGAFVDLGGVEGLVHVSELAHRQVATPDQVVKVGDEIDVVVLEVNPEKKKISLSRKRALPDPWAQFQAAHQPGDLVYGTVTGVAAFGAFVRLDGQELEGLIHISELSKFRVEDPNEVVAVGEGLWVKIIEITPEKKRLSLSLRRALD
jgi:small subunit ribosomal protein S1